jgi:SAM-dependent methyltransferase
MSVETTLEIPAFKLLNVGCGAPANSRLPKPFQHAQWQELRLDIDPATAPDIVSSITHMETVASQSIDAIWSSHNLEHLHSFEVPLALAEFKRVLKPTGFALISLPDMRAVARYIANDQLVQTLYESPAGPISALDIVFGHQASLKHGNHFMAHRTGFTARTLGDALVHAGFAEVRVHEGARWDLWALATMPETAAQVFDELGEVML